MTKSIRLIYILEQLSKGATLCPKELFPPSEVSLKSIQGDFSDLRDYFGEQLIKKGKCYALLNQEHFTQTFKNNPQTTKRFLHLVSMIDSSFYDKFVSEHKDLLKKLNFQNRPIYQIENSPYEYLKEENHQILEMLELFISKKNYVTIYYALPDINREVYHHSIPLKILYLGENWYLAVLTTNDIIENSAFKLLRINFIEKVKASTVEPMNFYDDNIGKIEADNFLKNIQSSFSKINRPTYIVRLKVHASKARYFKNKKYLKSQKVTKILEGDDIEVMYEISNDMEIIPIIQRWIPFVKVIEPRRIKEKIEENMKLFMKGE